MWGRVYVKSYNLTLVALENLSQRKNPKHRFSFSVTETPYIVKNPVTKARRAGQSVALCCKATGKPSPDKYFW